MTSSLGQVQFMSQSPPVKTDGWCGEYKYKPKIEVEN